MTKSENNSRKGFGSRIGFVLAASGSAVGLGNIWRFPYLAAKYGGGFFLLIYVILAVTFGFSLMITEFAIGRRTGKSVIGAYREADRRFGLLGWFTFIIPAVILSYYCVIGGWVLKYMTVYLTGRSSEAVDGVTADSGENISMFSDFISHWQQPTLFFLIYILLGAVVVLLGVQRGIEKVSKIMMPVLIILVVGVAVYTMTLKGAGSGARYYLEPDFNGFTAGKFFKTVAAAMGQLFYSMSLAMGINITYGSYMRKEDSLEKSVRQVEFFDTLIAFLAGLIIVPSVFVFSGGDKDALNAGPGLMFETLPKVFDSMKAGPLIGAVFFILVSFAALTSSISLMETVTAAVIEKFRMTRTKACFIVTAFTVLVGMLSVLGYSSWPDFTIWDKQILDFFDFITNNLMMPTVAFVTCILAGYIVKTKYIEEEVCFGGKQFRTKHIYRVMIKYVCPVCMIIILITPFVTEL